VHWGLSLFLGLVEQGSAKFFESRRVQGLGEQVSDVLLGRDVLGVDQLVLAHLTEMEVAAFEVARVPARSAVAQDALSSCLAPRCCIASSSFALASSSCSFALASLALASSSCSFALAMLALTSSKCC